MTLTQQTEKLTDELQRIIDEDSVLYNLNNAQIQRLQKIICENKKLRSLYQGFGVFVSVMLSEIVSSAVPAAVRRAKHPAKKTFMALRICVNDEFGAIDAFLKDIPRWIKPGGRLAIISFHSGEDRRVKEAMHRWQFPCTCPPRLPVCVCHKKPLGRVINKKAIEATPEELARNSRARSAKLRGFLFD